MQLSAQEQDVARRAAEFVDAWLIPYEQQAELAGGPLPHEVVAKIKAAALEAGVTGGLHRRERGGQSWSTVEWCLVEEQLGRSSNAVSWYVPNAYNVWRAASAELQQRWLEPALRGELHDAYAVTEELAGSDPSGIRTVARRVPDGWEISGEKWFVTFGSIASVIVVMAYALEPGENLEDPSTPRRGTLFAVPADAAGITTIDDPPFTHSYPDGHPTLRFTRYGSPTRTSSARSGRGRPAARLVRRGAPGDRGALGGAMQRLLHGGRRLDGLPGAGRRPAHRPPGGVVPARRLRRRRGRRPAADVRRGAPRRRGRRPEAGAREGQHGQAVLHRGRGTAADRVLQVFGGRGYMRTYVAERLWRELRVDRIWEGSRRCRASSSRGALEKPRRHAMLT